MSALRKKIEPYGARLITSNAVLACKRKLQEAKRQILVRPHQLDCYLRINDPYSYLLVQVMPSLQGRFSVQIGFRTILELQDDMYPEPQMWHDNAFIDACLLAELYHLSMPEQAPESDDKRVADYTAALMAMEAPYDVDWLKVQQLFAQYWAGAELKDATVLDVPHLERNQATLKQNGHYMSAMLNYGGEWYWGLDRLDHLENRFNEAGLNTSAALVEFDKTWQGFCSTPELSQQDPRTKKFILYFSIRSPYSHLGLEQALKLADHYQLEFELKPVLPMVMRGLKVPNTKKMYILHDTKREARKLGIDYGFVADPLGEGVLRCYALYLYAKSEGKENDYLLAYARAVNAQGVHSDTDEGLRQIVEGCGLEWQKAQQILSAPDWRESWQDWAEDNRREMVAKGQWGVPSVSYGDLTLWGQDRLVFIEKAIQQDLAQSD
jgi:2-hydroxychromene-2-carboxylate isomerase